ncbi:transcriptional regulator, TetR family [Granulicella rosea]|uniref:Transcriptional regulator, TetR family n=1 Tax=Granulicella rosea TaxID=474952 RepID=A0A239M1Q8_9BACT|nr:TetR/AcrR family transcriptional regulator [Granulicella rosea]SNT36242.1 transcriptional regulator, TetR family [Granulicella rosea]
MVDAKNIDQDGAGRFHRQKRGLATRKELLHSARFIFARDGFEVARIEEIALRAGKTRGAFYDHFKDKEDVFFAIFEENIDHDSAILTPLLLDLPTTEQRVAALAKYLSQLSEDRERTLLNLEFKLYAIRHPQDLRRLADLYGMMRLRSSIPELIPLLPQLDAAHAVPELPDFLAICAIMDGLSLNYLFDPDHMGSVEQARYLELCLAEALRREPGRTGMMHKETESKQ